MDRMVSYIFGSLGTSEEAIKKINRRLGKQSTINGWLFGLYIGSLVYSSGVNIKCITQDVKIKELEERISVLESGKEKG